MNKKQCRDALDLYKKFLIRMDRVAEFLKVAEVCLQQITMYVLYFAIVALLKGVLQTTRETYFIFLCTVLFSAVNLVCVSNKFITSLK